MAPAPLKEICLLLLLLLVKLRVHSNYEREQLTPTISRNVIMKYNLLLYTVRNIAEKTQNRATVSKYSCTVNNSAH